MSLLTPLGLLGLLSIVALIIIYIIRPNYQEKFISTTFVWNLSLKYRKKRIPTSKLRNILLIICQILILLLSTIILTTPSEVLKAQVEEPEVVIVLDSSASMRTASETEEDGEIRTRFEKALIKAEQKAEEIFSKNGTVSLILADEKPEFLLAGITKESKDALTAKFAELKENDVCSYGTSDIEASIDLCAEIYEDNPSAQMFIYTDGKYAALPVGGINVVNVSESDEWNAAILSVTSEKNNGYYLFVGEIACYNRSETITVNVDISDPNGRVNEDFSYQFFVDCTDGVPATFILAAKPSRDDAESEHMGYLENFNTTDQSLENFVVVEYIDLVYSYASINVNLEVADNMYQDDNFNIYGGDPEEVRVEYASSLHNRFINVMLGVMRDYYATKGMWDFTPYEKSGDGVVTEGYNYYIFEHVMPDTMPQDGFVLMLDPDSAPIGAGFDVVDTITVGKSVDLQSTGEIHKITSGMVPESITIYQYRKMTVNSDYTVLVEFNGDPIIAVKDDGASKVVVVGFSVHYSNIAIMFDQWCSFLQNVFEYFNPVTTDSKYYEVGDTVTLNARGETLIVEGNEIKKEFTSYDGAEDKIEFPTTMVFNTPGTYTLTQITDYDQQVEEQIFVKAPASESNIFELKNTLVNPYGVPDISDLFKDLALYFAIALVTILFIEWILQARDTM